METELHALRQMVFTLAINSEIIIWKAQGVPQLNNVAHPKHPEEDDTKQKPHNYVSIYLHLVYNLYILILQFLSFFCCFHEYVEAMNI